MTTSMSQVLVLGGAAAGKTTFLVQLYGRVKIGRGRLRARGAPSELTPIEDGLRRLQQGVSVKHTAQGTDVALTVPAVGTGGRPVDIIIPDYAGEDLRGMVHQRRIPDRWREAAAAGRWLLLIRLTKHPELPDVLSRPVGELASTPRVPDGDADALPVDMWAVELLQALRYWREQNTKALGTPPHLTLVLSCWDELDTAATPGEVAQERLALLAAYCRANWPVGRFTVVGLSAQGHALDDTRPADDYLDHGPQDMGWFVNVDGGTDPDLTALVTDSP